jgi:hypothetical protein
MPRERDIIIQNQMKYRLIYLTFLILALGTESCKKDKSEMQLLWDCNKSQHFDSTKLANHLIGTWKWKKMSYGLTTTPADKNVVVLFDSKGKFSVSENSVTVTRGSWRLKPVDSEILGLSMDTPSQYLYGRILLCSDQLLFNDSYRDGADNYFTRK